MKVILTHPVSGLKKEVKTDGFSWGAFLLGPLWYWLNGMWAKGFLYFIIGLLISWTYIGLPIMWVVMGFKFNEEHYVFLLERGHKEK